MLSASTCYAGFDELIGAMIEAEVSTSIGRIDAVVKTRTDIFIFEFKLRDTAEAAMRQIREKRYFVPYLDDGRRITLVGAAFDPGTRNLGKWLIEPA
ncbi:MAG: PD-(D/E)XK nuclease domain-containing protein [Verrucomicrobia bacterium]|nr:PD-(D/E)XK nuclease domain-containing protein [Verrucomicrobiota bacterium]